MLFQRFDRLLFLAKGGRTVYFGEVGKNSSILTNYFQKNGAFPCPPDANPAEWMLEVIGAAPGSRSDIDWHQAWLDSSERVAVRDELADMKQGRLQTVKSVGGSDKTAFKEFAAPMTQQIYQVMKRVFEQYWRTPSYIYSKLALVTGAGLFIGFSFYDAGTSQQALQNQMFSVFMLLTIFGQLTQQIMPQFVTQRSLYEARERPSKTYSWKAFMLSVIVVELPWNLLAGMIIFFCWYYPIGKLYLPSIHPSPALMTPPWLTVQSTMLIPVIRFLQKCHTYGHSARTRRPDVPPHRSFPPLRFNLCPHDDRRHSRRRNRRQHGQPYVLPLSDLLRCPCLTCGVPIFLDIHGTRNVNFRQQITQEANFYPSTVSVPSPISSAPC